MSDRVPDGWTVRSNDWMVHEQIRKLALRYAVAVDRRDLDLLVSLFVDDVNVGARGTGREALRAEFDESLRAIGVSMLFVGNHLIDRDEHDSNKATGVVYCRARIQPEPDSPRMIEQAIQYSERYECRDGRWHFVGRKHELFWGVQLAEQPPVPPPADWPASQVGVGTVPHRYESWQRFWGA